MLGLVSGDSLERVRILWDEECLGVSDVRTSDHKLVKGNWNLKTAKKGGWRQNLSGD